MINTRITRYGRLANLLQYNNKMLNCIMFLLLTYLYPGAQRWYQLDVEGRMLARGY